MCLVWGTPETLYMVVVLGCLADTYAGDSNCISLPATSKVTLVIPQLQAT